MTKHIIGAVLITGLLLAGCTSSTPSESTAPAQPENQGSNLNGLRPSNVAADSVAKSSGDADADLKAIETQLDSLDTQTDFPSFNQQDLEP